MIFISAGHHPSAPGAKYERFVEHDEAVIWTEELAAALDGDGILVPVGVLREKVNFINARLMNGDVAVEIHFNAAMKDGENVGRGSETLYYPGSDKGKALAEKMQECLGAIFPPDRGAKEGWYQMNPAKGADFFLAKTKCPSIIVEPEFVHRFDLIADKRTEAIIVLAKALREFINGR